MGGPDEADAMNLRNLSLAAAFFFVPLLLSFGGGRVGGLIGLVACGLILLAGLWFAALVLGLGGGNRGTAMTAFLPVAGTVAGYLLARYAV
jgi:hypothetical protein